MKKYKEQAFTLMEVMMVVFIVAILAAIAIPNYGKAIEQSRLAEAINMLGAIRKAELQYAQKSETYTSNLTQLDMDYNTTSVRFFDFRAPVNANTLPYDGQNEVLANATRNGIQVTGGYASDYWAAIYEEGDIVTGAQGGNPPLCFLAGTLITMADGSQKPVEEIKVGDIVLAFNENTGQIEPDTVSKVFSNLKGDAYLIINHTLKVTSEHPVLSKGKWLKIKDLKIGDTLTDTQGKDVAIFDIAKANESVEVYNFETNPLHTYIAGGFIVHNKTKLQN